MIRYPHNWCEDGSIKGADTREYHGCMFPFRFFSIYANGDVPICCADLNGEYIIGNILDSSIEELWDGPMESIRTRMRNGDPIPELCDRCERYKSSS